MKKFKGSESVQLCQHKSVKSFWIYSGMEENRILLAVVAGFPGQGRLQIVCHARIYGLCFLLNASILINWLLTYHIHVIHLCFLS